MFAKIYRFTPSILHNNSVLVKGSFDPMSLHTYSLSGTPSLTELSPTEAQTAIPSVSLSTASRERPLPPVTVTARRSCFQVTALDEPQILLKLLGLFAARDLTPAVVRSVREQDRLQIEIMQDGMDDHMADIVAAKISNLVEVEECFFSRFARV